MTWDSIGVRDRLAVLAAADPAYERFGAGRHQYQLKAPIPASDIAVFEQQHGIRLPDAYRSFLTDIGSGGAGPYYGLFDWRDIPIRHDEVFAPGFLSTPFPHEEEWNPNADASSLIPDEEYWDPRWVTGSFAIVEFGCGAFFRLVVSGPATGQVWFDDRATDGGLQPGPQFHLWYASWLTAPTRRRPRETVTAKDSDFSYSLPRFLDGE
jgi:hypothetical protein